MSNSKSALDIVQKVVVPVEPSEQQGDEEQEVDQNPRRLLLPKPELPSRILRELRDDRLRDLGLSALLFGKTCDFVHQLVRFFFLEGHAVEESQPDLVRQPPELRI